MQVMVSVLTITYNHAPFIAEALESFVSQKTSFAFEVIVHDDASTDGTAEIIREYAQKYPDIIRPVLQTENQYSKGKDIFEFMMPLVRGKYIAQCEGDDYWCDENKLQKQVDFLEAHSDYVACAHNTMLIDHASGKRKAMFAEGPTVELRFEDLIKGGHAGCHVNSIMYRKGIEIPKEMLKGKSFGDYQLMTMLSLQGKMCRFGEVMSVYRYKTPGSWSEKFSQSDQRKLQIYRENIELMNQIDAYTGKKYEALIAECRQKYEFGVLDVTKQYARLKCAPYREIYQKKPLLYKIKLNVKQYVPLLDDVYHALKAKVTGQECMAFRRRRKAKA